MLDGTAGGKGECRGETLDRADLHGAAEEFTALPEYGESAIRLRISRKLQAGLRIPAHAGFGRTRVRKRSMGIFRQPGADEPK
jgi:hypothetical protein